VKTSLRIIIYKYMDATNCATDSELVPDGWYDADHFRCRWHRIIRSIAKLSADNSRGSYFSAMLHRIPSDPSFIRQGVIVLKREFFRRDR
jgi:hypothetical protein